uniref:Transmembrane protein 209 n=1 Tax=Heterorhabditis bacteriophora TaxID=37862 RepID=A0A1I7XTE8_HETBA
MGKIPPLISDQHTIAANDSRLSPTAQQGFKRRNMELERSQKMRSLLLPWILVLVAVCCEIFMFGSWFGSLLLGSFFPIIIISWCEYALLGYVITMITWLLYYVVNPHSIGSVQMPINCECYIVHFHENLVNVSMNDSSFRLHTSGMSDVSTDLPLSACISSRTSPYNKQIDSIHTREQLDRLLRKDFDSTHVDLSSSSLRSSMYSHFNVLDIGCTSERRGYQLSEEIKQGDGKDSGSLCFFLRINCKMLDQIFVVVLLLNCYSSRLEEADLQRGEHRLRAWIVNTIIGPLNMKIKEVNAILEKEHISPPLHIDSSSVDTLLAAINDRPTLLDTALPYILPYLSCHANQAYLVARISELAADPFMKDYRWNGGGSEWIDEKISTGRIARRPWGEHLPADSTIVFSLFCTYMDGQLTATPLVGPGKIEQPFSSVFTLKTPQKPSSRHLAAGSFYIHMVNSFSLALHVNSVCPPHWEFVSTDSDGSPARAPIARGPSNLFRAILQLIHHAKYFLVYLNTQ